MIARLLNALALAALIVVAGGWLVFLRPASLGGPATWIIVRGDSMLPTYETGDLIVFHEAPTYSVGDVVAYRVPAGELGAGRIVMHRIIGGDLEGGLILQGDNNPVPDPWRPRQADVAGAIWLVGSQFGRPIVLLHQPAIAAALAASVMVAVVLGRQTTTRVSSRPRPRATGAASTDGGTWLAGAAVMAHAAGASSSSWAPPDGLDRPKERRSSWFGAITARSRWIGTFDALPTDGAAWLARASVLAQIGGSPSLAAPTAAPGGGVHANRGWPGRSAASGTGRS